MLPLLRNHDVRVHPRCQRHTLVFAAIHGPFKREGLERTDKILYALFFIAMTVVILDLTLWRS
jgi:hypothetical protein